MNIAIERIKKEKTKKQLLFTIMSHTLDDFFTGQAYQDF